MVEISSSDSGPGRYRVRIEMREKEKNRGVQYIRPNLIMNTGQGVLRTNVTFLVEEQELLSHEMYLHREDLIAWVEAVRGAIQDPAAFEWPVVNRTLTGFERVIESDVTSPELILRLTQEVHLLRPGRPLPDAPGHSHEADEMKTALARYVFENSAEEYLESAYQNMMAPYAFYRLLVIVDLGIALGQGASRQGPAMALEPEEEELVRFIDSLEREARRA